MPTPIESLVAEWFVDDLNTEARGWSMAFTAERKPTPVFALDELQNLRCAVTAIVIENEQEARELWVFRYMIVVSFQKQVDQTDIEAVDALSYLVQQVHDYYRTTQPAVTVAGLTASEVMNAQRPESYDLERLQVQGVFDSYLILTTQGYRA